MFLKKNSLNLLFFTLLAGFSFAFNELSAKQRRVVPHYASYGQRYQHAGYHGKWGGNPWGYGSYAPYYNSPYYNSYPYYTYDRYYYPYYYYPAGYSTKIFYYSY